MRKIILAVALSLGVSLGGCAQVQKVFEVATSSITNPISQTDIYRAKNVYGATLQLVIEYRDYCWSKPYAQLMADPIAKPVCANRRQVVRQVNAYGPNAGAAIRKAEAFVRDNPTINATTALTAMWDAVNAFKSSVPAIR